MNRECIIGKVLLEGTLKLMSPLLIGSGIQRTGNNIDTQILLNENGCPLIPGTSVAGVLRAAMPEALANVFFGGKLNREGFPKGLEVQSAVNIDDVELADKQTVLRDGVRIDMVRGVAADEAKFDYELVERGATGYFCMEITLRAYHEEILGDNIPKEIRKMAARIAKGFRLGAMTAKGFGRVCVCGLTVNHYDFRKKEDAVAWLTPEEKGKRRKASNHYVITKQDTENVSALTDSNLIVDAEFALEGSLLVKEPDIPDEKKKGKSPVHAMMKKSREEYLIPGPSIKGALRHHAGRILERLGVKEIRPILNSLMGLDDKALREAKERNDQETLRQSRLFVDEAYIKASDVQYVKQTRNRIDRFTGGTIGGALFSTEAIWGKRGKKPVRLHFEIRHAEKEDVGLAMLLLKDLFLGRLPLGGEKSVGRGVLRGINATVTYERNTFEIQDGRLVKGEKSILQDCVTALAAKGEAKA